MERWQHIIWWYDTSLIWTTCAAFVYFYWNTESYIWHLAVIRLIHITIHVLQSKWAHLYWELLCYHVQMTTHTTVLQTVSKFPVPDFPHCCSYIRTWEYSYKYFFQTITCSLIKPKAKNFALFQHSVNFYCRLHLHNSKLIYYYKSAF